MSAQTFFMTLCRLLVSKKEWKKDPRTLSAIRRAFMKDIVDLKHYGSWSEFLKTFGFAYISDIDKELEVRTSAVERGRSAWMCRSMGSGMGSASNEGKYIKHDPKCCSLYCDNLQSELEPFLVECNVCHEAMYCSDECRLRDFNAHHHHCHPAKQEKTLVSVKKEKSLDSLGLCDNCGNTLESDKLRVCTGCGKVRFCSSFCAEYSMKRGVHGKKCIVGPRRFCYFENSCYDDLEHPGRCIICHESFKAQQQIVVVDSCLYKRRYCLCNTCSDKLEILPTTQNKHCPFCRLALVER